MGDEFDFLLQKVEEVLAKINKKREEILAADVLIMKLKDEKVKYKSEFLNKIQTLHRINQDHHENLHKACAAEVQNSSLHQEIAKHESEALKEQTSVVALESELKEKSGFLNFAQSVISVSKKFGGECIGNFSERKSVIVQSTLLGKKKKDDNLTNQTNKLMESISNESAKIANVRAKIKLLKHQVHCANSELIKSRCKDRGIANCNKINESHGDPEVLKMKTITLRREIVSLQAACNKLIKNIRLHKVKKF